MRIRRSRSKWRVRLEKSEQEIESNRQEDGFRAPAQGRAFVGVTDRRRSTVMAMTRAHKNSPERERVRQKDRVPHKNWQEVLQQRQGELNR